MSSLHLVIFHLWQTDYSKIVHSLKLPILNVFKFHFISSFINLALTRCMLYRHHFNTLIPLLSLSLSARIGYPENTHRRRKYFCTAGSQFDWFWFSSFSTYKQWHIFMFGQIQSSSTGCHPWSDPSPRRVFYGSSFITTQSINSLFIFFMLYDISLFNHTSSSIKSLYEFYNIFTSSDYF